MACGLWGLDVLGEEHSLVSPLPAFEMLDPEFQARKCFLRPGVAFTGLHNSCQNLTDCWSIFCKHPHSGFLGYYGRTVLDGLKQPGIR